MIRHDSIDISNDSHDSLMEDSTILVEEAENIMRSYVETPDI